MDRLEGRYRVRRVAGVLPPGLRKSVAGERGWTALGRLKLLPIRLKGTTLRYPHLPLRDELVSEGDGQWLGTGYVLGVPFCRFVLEPMPPKGS